MSSDPKPETGRAGCWGAALIVVGVLIAVVSGLCVGGGIVGTILDLMEGAAPLENILGVTLTYMAVAGPFLAGGIALIVWGLRIQRRK